MKNTSNDDQEWITVDSGKIYPNDPNRTPFQVSFKKDWLKQELNLPLPVKEYTVPFFSLLVNINDNLIVDAIELDPTPTKDRYNDFARRFDAEIRKQNALLIVHDAFNFFELPKDRTDVADDLYRTAHEDYDIFTKEIKQRVYDIRNPNWEDLSNQLSIQIMTDVTPILRKAFPLNQHLQNITTYERPYEWRRSNFAARDENLKRIINEADPNK